MPPTRWNRRKMQCFEDGEPMAVARPSHPQRVLELAKELDEHPQSKDPVWSTKLWQAMEKQLNEECGPYTFVGYLARVTKRNPEMKHILDEKGRLIDEFRPGDSVTRESLWIDDVEGTP